MIHQVKLIVIAIFGVLFCACNGNNKVRKKLELMAEKLNTSTPVMLDEYTRFDSVAVSHENVFQYFYTIVNTPYPDSLIQNQEESVTRKLRAMLQSHPDLHVFEQNKVPLSYIYRDSTGKVIHTIHIASDFYSK